MYRHPGESKYVKRVEVKLVGRLWSRPGYFLFAVDFITGRTLSKTEAIRAADRR